MIFGERLSVRLPRRIVPIWVSEPIGLARFLRMATTPAMVVVLTAPSPTRRTPSLPRAGAMSVDRVTIGHGTSGILKRQAWFGLMRSRVVSRPPTCKSRKQSRPSLHQSYKHLRYRCDVHDVLCRPVRDSAWQKIAASTQRDVLQDFPRPRIRPIQVTARLRQDLREVDSQSAAISTIGRYIMGKWGCFCGVPRTCAIRWRWP